MMLFSSSSRPAARDPGLPVGALLALAGFITVMTEALPAGLLPQIGAGLQVSEAYAGQLITVYALGSLLAALPLTAATLGVRRRSLLLAAIAGFVAANSVTALAGSYALALAARFLAGVSAGLLWALLAGYAARMVPESLKGRAIAIAMVGTPLALAFGVPAGAWLGALMGWRLCFGLMSVAALLLMVWVRVRVPDFAGQRAGARRALAGVFVLAGVRPVLLAVLGVVLAHNMLYTYIAPLLATAGLLAQTDRVLLVFGVMSLGGIWVIGVLIDHHLRRLTLLSIALFGAAALLLSLAVQTPAVVYGAVAIWGLGFGGVATLFQTALAKVAGEAADVAQAMLVTTWNIGIAGGALLGGVLLEQWGVTTLPPALLGLLVLAWAVVYAAGTHGFPRQTRAGTRRQCQAGGAA